MKKRNYPFVGIVLFIVVVCLIIMMPILTQENNTIFVLSGVVKLTFGSDDIVEYDHDDSFKYYISKSETGEESIEELMYDDNFLLSDQVGSAFTFTDSDDSSKTIVVESRQFTRYYRLWQVSIKSDFN